MSETGNTKIDHYFDAKDGYTVHGGYPVALCVTEYRCPNDVCKKVSLVVNGVNGCDFSGLHEMIWPKNICEQYPAYVPQSIRRDYEEACAIKTLSPKASATLSRRCLQGMIRDFWGINGKKTLFEEIKSLSGKVDIDLINALTALRSIGNIGAHPETDVNLIVDIDPSEAEDLIKFIEVLIDEWYVARERRQQLLTKIQTTNGNKQAARNGTT